MQEFDTIVVGAGISGLYCSLRLAERDPRRKVGLFEASDRFGGRIETVEMDGFLAECGPMRFEERRQRLLMGLLDELGLKTRPFVRYTAEPIQGPRHPLAPDEAGPADRPHSTLELMKLGILRILKDTEWRSPGDPDDPRDEKHRDWLRSLDEDDYAGMRRRARQGGAFLYERGFWNALSDVLSHGAVLAIRDQGTFYHLIPENPNAMDWIIFWLRALSGEGEGEATLVSIEGGSRALPLALVRRLEQRSEQVSIHLRHALTSLAEAEGGRIRLQFSRGEETVEAVAKHVILALPRSPLMRLAGCFSREIQRDLDSVFGFPLLKCFLVTDAPWWTGRTPPQRNASLMPAREVHYTYRESDGKGMAMLYTDRPATEFWKVYVEGEAHDRAEIDRSEELKRQLLKYLGVDLQEPAERRRAAGAVTTWGIRDWSREPYGAGCHTWRPGARSWEVLERLRAFNLPGSAAPAGNVHVCGEAYCDYQGIEGALRSAESALKTVP
ncbi:flavin monoamine oxidase family protein [Sorangium sp. So ce1097]|uniref:flavin monoamine oxidase family protein n=1 Tax=Sorangium sp. So ce1097 TaxID=3133330 RepID=UPI003F641527